MTHTNTLKQKLGRYLAELSRDIGQFVAAEYCPDAKDPAVFLGIDAETPDVPVIKWAAEYAAGTKHMSAADLVAVATDTGTFTEFRDGKFCFVTDHPFDYMLACGAYDAQDIINALFRKYHRAGIFETQEDFCRVMLKAGISGKFFLSAYSRYLTIQETSLGKLTNKLTEYLSGLSRDIGRFIADSFSPDDINPAVDLGIYPDKFNSQLASHSANYYYNTTVFNRGADYYVSLLTDVHAVDMFENFCSRGYYYQADDLQLDQYAAKCADIIISTLYEASLTGKGLAVNPSAYDEYYHDGDPLPYLLPACTCEEFCTVLLDLNLGPSLYAYLFKLYATYAMFQDFVEPGDNHNLALFRKRVLDRFNRTVNR